MNVYQVAFLIILTTVCICAILFFAAFLVHFIRSKDADG